MIFGNFLKILGCTHFFWGQKRIIYHLIHTLFFHRSSDNIQKLLLDPKKVGVRGGGRHVAAQYKIFFNKNANFTQKKLSHPNYCYLSF